MTTRPVLVVAAARDPFVAELVRLLQSEGRETVVSHDTGSALKIARSKRPAVAVLDSVVPDGNGLALCRQLKSDPATAGLPVFFFSVLMARDQCLEAGADGFMLKPTEQDQLLEMIRDILDTRVTPLRQRPR